MARRMVYFDHASTSPLRPSVEAAMRPFHNDRFGNASSPHTMGREARATLDEARDRVAGAMGVTAREIIFTSGGTESLFLSLTGVLLGNMHRGRHMLTTTFEHHAVHGALEFLTSQMGVDLEKVSVDEEGILRLDELEGKLRDDTVLVSVMMVNNEVGTIQDLEALVDVCAPKGILVQSDCVQAVGKTPLNYRELGIDIASASGHKFGGPKGTGFTYFKEGTQVASICHGSHEFGLRAGTENVPGIVGLSMAVEEAVNELGEVEERLEGFRGQLWDCIRSVAPDAVINGSTERRVPAVLNVRFPGCEGEMLVLALDRAGVACSSGSACQSDIPEPSHVLSAMGQSPQDALSALRLSMAYSTTREDVDHFVSVFPEVYERVKAAAVH